MSAVNNNPPSVKNVSFDRQIDANTTLTSEAAKSSKGILARTTSSLFSSSVTKKQESSKPIKGESVVSGNKSDKIPKKKMMSLFRTKSKISLPGAASSSDSVAASSSKKSTIALPTSAKLTNTDKNLKQIEGLEESIAAFKEELGKASSPELGARLSGVIAKKEAEVASLKEAILESGASKAKQIGDFIGQLEDHEIESLGLEELQSLKENLDTARELKIGQFEAQTEFLEGVEKFQKNPENSSQLAAFCMDKSKEGDARFFHKDLEGGTGKVTAIGYRHEGVSEPLFVFKPISCAPGSPTFKNKWELPKEQEIRQEINTLIKTYKQDKENIQINGQGYNVVKMLSDSGLDNVTAFREKYSLNDLSSFKADFNLEGLENKDAGTIFSNMVGLFKYRYDVSGGVYEVNLMEKPPANLGRQDELSEQNMNILTEKIMKGAEAELTTKAESLKFFEKERPAFYGGVRQVEVNHVVRSELSVLKSAQPISSLAHLDTSEGEGVLIEFCKNSGNLEELAMEDPGIAREMLDGATDEVKTLVLNQYIMDVLFGSTDNNIGNALVTLKNDSQVPFENNGNQIVGIVFIDLGLCMPKIGKDKELGPLQSGEPLYQGCAFMNEGVSKGFLKDRVSEISKEFPAILQEITSRYESHGGALTPFQKNAMTARLEVLKMALNRDIPQHKVSNFIASPEFFNVLEASVNKKGEIVIAKLVSLISKSLETI